MPRRGRQRDRGLQKRQRNAPRPDKGARVLLGQGQNDRAGAAEVPSFLDLISRFDEETLTKGLGQEALKHKDFPIAQRYLLRSKDLPNQILLLKQWMKEGKEGEKDLFVARYVLLYTPSAHL